MRHWVVLAVDWAAIGAIAGVAGVVVAVAALALQHRSKGTDAPGDEPDRGPPPDRRTGLAEDQIAALSQRLTAYTGVIYDMNLEQRSPEGRKKNFTPKYMEWAKQEDQLRSDILLMLDPTKPEQERLVDAVESFGRKADLDEPWITRRDRLLEVAQEVYAAEREGTG